MATSKLVVDPKLLERAEDPEWALAFARIETHYFVNGGFYPEGALLEKTNIDKIRNIPTVIVQGRYDVVCPAKTAWDLHRAFPEAKFILNATSGHSSGEADTCKELVKAADAWRDYLSPPSDSLADVQLGRFSRTDTLGQVAENTPQGSTRKNLEQPSDPFGQTNIDPFKLERKSESGTYPANPCFILYHYAVSLCCIIMLYHYPVSLCCIIMLYHYAVSLCCMQRGARPIYMIGFLLMCSGERGRCPPIYMIGFLLMCRSQSLGCGE